MKIEIVVVTYNRLAFLKDCLKSIKAQTQSFDKILIVNNGSTDGTGEWLESLQDENIRLIHQGNLGGAGGFRTGIKAAYEDGADWIWVMDDDVEVASDCLKKLISYTGSSHCLYPHKQYIDGSDCNLEVYFDIDTGFVFELKNVSFRNGKDVAYTNVACFEGMLINRSIIDKIGFPDERFFIVNDDVMYSFVASFHTNVAYVKDAIIISKKKSGVSYETDFYIYYFIRNRHLVEEYIDKYYPGINKRTRRVLYRLYVLKKLVVFSFRDRKKVNDKFKTAIVIIRAYRDYLRKKIGNTF